MNFEKARFNMVEQQIRPWDVLDQDVLDLMMVVRREDFVPPAWRNLAFADIQIPLGHGEVMLEPKLEAKVLQAVQVRKSDRVLEIGAGSGYMAALLGARADHVWTVEIDPEIAAFARDNLARQSVANVKVDVGDGSKGWKAHAPYDVIVLSGGVTEVPAAVLSQLKVHGRLFAFVGEAPVMEARLITCVSEDAYNSADLFETVVPMLKNFPQPNRFEF